ncbi:hypothetical protein [Natrinema salifodinae]|uniref:Uncharacterized protein n=1 Tax=Natrinema salifodinae TaxID=1202768 RepID=A0A1I0NET1_9EURY|nr:hypothetical protein [Natrinema salifodinae]SEV99927.1 hypothetical protein SAMN05216285_1661 [Natrinema salifodinae]
MGCPYLAYRDGSDDPDRDHDSFDEPRAYCTAADRFVQPMRADICNDRYDLTHDRDCEIYREHADDASPAGADVPSVKPNGTAETEGDDA